MTTDTCSTARHKAIFGGVVAIGIVGMAPRTICHRFIAASMTKSRETIGALDRVLSIEKSIDRIFAYSCSFFGPEIR